MNNVNNIQSPKRNNKLNNRDAANKMRHGSPRFQEVLRQRCRERMTEKRRELFNARRQGVGENDGLSVDILTDIVRGEFSNMSTDEDSNMFDIAANNNMGSFEEVYLHETILREEEKWLLEEYQRLQEFEQAMDEVFAFGWQNEVFCPMCQKHIMCEESELLVCKGCQFELPAKISLQNFSDVINSKTAYHSMNCNSLPTFITVPENNSVLLYLTCDNCSCCSLII